MGIVSNAALQNGGEVTGVIPYAMHIAGGERDKISTVHGTATASESDRAKMKTIIVDSMHERKVEMARLSGGFIGLPGGFGTYEEVFEVTTWTQLGIHRKPVVLLNVKSFFDPLRQLICNGINEGYINPSNEALILFVDGPASHDEHDTFNWGAAAIEAVENWESDGVKYLFDWTKRKDGTSSASLESV
ncbi:hypothetical protein DXG03_002689 [Asterophora parasitica]|uniref:Lysine decarboxylase n=1 Tax=Asterophora parasitica TaxID=117018 RepID=A0A9P7GBU8_9AGAR|nr:hypothetical protein DXG03_002689 [Asterophora parasitica]